MDKQSLRKSIIAKRLELTSEEVCAKSNKVCNKIINMPEYKASKVVYLYYPVNNELDTTAIMEDCMKSGKVMAFPKVEDGEINFYIASDLDDFKPGKYNIPEPKGSELAPEPDIIIVPGVAFSNDGMRVGYGGGFYDRFLSNTSVHSIGACYSMQLLKYVPTMSHDQRLDEVVYDE